MDGVGSTGPAGIGTPEKGRLKGPMTNDDRSGPGLGDAGELARLLPAIAHRGYLNTGTCGPLFAPGGDALCEALETELERGRIGSAAFAERQGQRERLRSQLANLLGADEGEVALSHHTGEGLNAVLTAKRWSEGDRIVTTSLEHESALLPLYLLHRRFGVQVEHVDVGQGATEAVLDAFVDALGRPARLVVVSHVTWSTGAVLPLVQIADLARDAGATVLVDGAQSVGAMSVQPGELGVEAYAFPGQKWLLGPEGTGGLWVDSRALATMEPAQVGYGGADLDAYRPGDPDSLRFVDEARRFEVGSFFAPALSALAASVEWLTPRIASGAVPERVRSVAALAREAISEHLVPLGAALLTPVNHAGLVSVKIPAPGPAEAVERLGEAGFIVRSIPDNGSIRLSCGFFTPPEQVEAAVETLARVVHAATR